MYHTIEDLIAKVDVIKEKSDALRNRNYRPDQSWEQIQFEIADIQALCREIANDRGGEGGY